MWALRLRATAFQSTELGPAGGYQTSTKSRGMPSSDPNVCALTAMIYGALRGSRSIGAKIDDRVAQRVAKLLTSSKIEDFERGVRIVSRNDKLFRAVAGGARGAISGGDAASQNERRRQRGMLTVDRACKGTETWFRLA